MKIAVIGDLFVGSAIIEKALMKQLTAHTDQLTFSSLDVKWPLTPLGHDNDEVTEFVGSPAEVARIAAGADVIVTHVAPVTSEVLDAVPDLQIVACCRGGPVNVNVSAATQRGIAVVNAPGRNSRAVVEFTLGLILAECRGISRAHCAMTNGIWQGDLYCYDKAGRELEGQVVGLVGFGIIAQMLVPYLKPFNVRILAYDPYVPSERFNALGVEQTDLETLLRNSDIVSLHARLTSETRGMMSEQQFGWMKAGAVLVNTARGGLVDYDALYKALENGHLGGAALDTFSAEPPPSDWPLLKSNQVTLTPHIAGSSRESARRGVDIVVSDITNYFADRPLKHCLNPAVLKADHTRKRQK